MRQTANAVKSNRNYIYGTYQKLRCLASCNFSVEQQTEKVHYSLVKISTMLKSSKKIANSLQLPSSEMFCSLLGVWKSTTVAETYIVNQKINKIVTAKNYKLRRCKGILLGMLDAQSLHFLLSLQSVTLSTQTGYHKKIQILVQLKLFKLKHLGKRQKRTRRQNIEKCKIVLYFH